MERGEVQLREVSADVSDPFATAERSDPLKEGFDGVHDRHFETSRSRSISWVAVHHESRELNVGFRQSREGDETALMKLHIKRARLKFDRRLEGFL